MGAKRLGYRVETTKGENRGKATGGNDLGLGVVVCVWGGGGGEGGVLTTCYLWRDVS